MGTTWRSRSGDDEEEPPEGSWLERDPAPGEATPFGTPAPRRGVLGTLRRWWRGRG